MKKIVLISMLGLLLFGCGQSEQNIKEDNQAKQTEQSDADNQNNIENKDSINCEVINVNKEGYTCSGLTTFVKKETLEKNSRNLE